MVVKTTQETNACSKLEFKTLEFCTEYYIVLNMPVYSNKDVYFWLMGALTELLLNLTMLKTTLTFKCSTGIIFLIKH